VGNRAMRKQMCDDFIAASKKTNKNDAHERNFMHTKEYVEASINMVRTFEIIQVQFLANYGMLWLNNIFVYAIGRRAEFVQDSSELEKQGWNVSGYNY
jgi:hypothetical protein